MYVGVCVTGLQLDYLFHFSVISDRLVGFRSPHDSTVELGWVMCHCLYIHKFGMRYSGLKLMLWGFVCYFSI